MNYENVLCLCLRFFFFKKEEPRSRVIRLFRLCFVTKIVRSLGVGSMDHWEYIRERQGVLGIAANLKGSVKDDSSTKKWNLLLEQKK